MSRKARLTILVAVVLVNPSVLGSTIYFNDFEGAVGTEWSNRTTDVTPIGSRRFLGQFCNDTVTLTLAQLPPHGQVKVSFDLFIIRSWDGIGLPDPRDGVWGPDKWSLNSRDGSMNFMTTFDNHYTILHAPFHKQSFPGQYPDGTFIPQTAADETNSLGYTWPFSGERLAGADSVYRLSFGFSHSTSALTFDFSASGLEDLANESWGIDNVKVELPDVLQGQTAPHVDC